MCKRFNVAWKRNTVPITAALRCVNTRLQASPRRSADGLAGEVVFVLYAFFCESTKVGRYLFINRVPALLVGKIEDNVFFPIIFPLYFLCYKSDNCVVKINNCNCGNNCCKNSFNYFLISFLFILAPKSPPTTAQIIATISVAMSNSGIV